MKRFKFTLLAATLVFAAAAGLYAPSVRPVLIWDDDVYIGNSSFVRDCSNMGAALNPVNLFMILPVTMSARPVMNISLIADACLGGGNAGMHRTNVLLHALNAVLLFFLILTLSDALLPALFGALVFAVHPLAAEAVNIITFRAHLLGFLFFISGLLAAVLYAREGRLRQAAATAICYLLAMLSVETAVVLPLAALAAAYFDQGREGAKRILPVMAVLGVLLVYYLWFRLPRSGYDITGISSRGLGIYSFLYPEFIFSAAKAAGMAARGEVQTFILTPPWHRIYEDYPARLYTMSRITLDYFKALLLPVGLSTDYNPAVITSVTSGLLPLTAVGAGLALSARLLIRRRLAGLGLLLAFIALLPVLNIWPIYNIKADRYLYLPSAGFALGAAAILARILRAIGPWRAYLAASAWLWAGTLLILSLARIPDFRDNISFFSAVVKTNPGAARARLNLATAHQRSGNLQAYLDNTAQAVKLDPKNNNIRLWLADALAQTGRLEEAAKQTLFILKTDPRHSGALNLARMLRLNTYAPSTLGSGYRIPQAPGKFKDVAPTRFSIWIVTCEACSECAPTMAATLQRRHPAAAITQVDAASENGAALIARHRIQTLPFYILDQDFEREQDFRYLKPDFAHVGHYYFMTPGPDTYTPCVWLNRALRPRHLDLFVAPLSPDTAKIEAKLFSLLREPAFNDLTVSMHFLVEGSSGAALTSAHGTEGVRESLLQACLFQNASLGSYLAYIECRNTAAGGRQRPPACLEPNDEITNCIENGAGERLLRQDIELSRELGIKASGTILWENRYGPFEWNKINFSELTRAKKQAEML